MMKNSKTASRIAVLSGLTILQVATYVSVTNAQPSAEAATGRVVYASEAGAALDSNLMTGGGTDDTAVLQKILNRAEKGSALHLIIDGPALVSGLEIYSHTTVECTAGGGIFLKDGSKGAILRNAHRSRNAVIDEHIEIRGCFLNGNRKGQPRTLASEKVLFRYVAEADGTFRSALQFFGVNYFTLENVTLQNAHGFHLWVANARFISLRNIFVDTGIPAFPERASLAEQKEWTTQYGSNDDGLAFTGPIQYLTIDGAKLRTWDDSISIRSNDWGIGGSYATDDITLKNEMSPYVGQGPVTDVIINNVMFMDSHRGIRLLSSDQRMDRILIQNVTGTNRERFVQISHMANPSLGNFGSITFSNVNVDAAAHPTWMDLRGQTLDKLSAAGQKGVLEENERPLFGLNAHIENLQLNQIVTRPVDNRPLIRVGPDADIAMLDVSLKIIDPDLRALPVQLMGRIQKFQLSLDWKGADPIKYQGGKIERLDWKKEIP
jgi:hypothetical protein